MDMPESRIRVVVCGWGRVGRAFAESTRQAGITTFITDTHKVLLQTPTILPDFITAVFSTDDVVPSPDPTFWFVCTPEDQIHGLVGRIVHSPGFNSVTDCTAIASATFDTGELSASCGHRVGRAHPLHPFAPVAASVPVPPGTPFGISNLPDHAIDLLRYLGFMPFYLDDSKRNLYHAAAVLVSNLPAALARQAADIFSECGVPDCESVSVRMLGALHNVVSADGPAAVPGPAARGDKVTIAADQRALDNFDPDTGRVHRILSEVIVRMTSGRLR